jgi:hypothetical protein
MTQPNAEAVAFATVLVNYLAANPPVDAMPMKWQSNRLQLGSRRVLKDNCLFSIMNGDSRTGVIARPFRIRDLAKKFFTFNDVKTYSFTVPRENTQDHVVLGNNHSQRTRLII